MAASITQKAIMNEKRRLLLHHLDELELAKARDTWLATELRRRIAETEQWLSEAELDT